MDRKDQFVKNTLVSGITNFTHSFSDASSAAKKESYDENYDKYYHKAYDKAMKENAISNSIYISVTGIQEMSKYEVLAVIEDATITETEEQKNEGIYAWTRYKGKGIYTVDLEKSEILVDHANYYVSIRIPHPVFSYIPLVEETEKMLYIDNRKQYFFFPKKDTKTGLDIRDQQSSKAHDQIYNSIKNNNSYYEKANEFAISSLTNLVKSLNPDIADKLTIDISFND